MAAMNLTPREVEILVGFITECNTNVDWAKVAAAAKCTTPKYARDKFALIKNKIVNSIANEDAAGGVDSGEATPKKSTPNKGKKAQATPKRKRDDGDDDEGESPAKKTKAKNKVAKKDSTPNEEDAHVKEEPNEAGELMDDLST